MKKSLLVLVANACIHTCIAQDTTVNGIKYPKPVNFTSQQNQDNMMQQLGIKKLRPGPSGNESAPNHANYDTAKADPCPLLPDILTLNNGKKVTSADIWFQQRRPEIMEDYEREVYGRIPRHVPKLVWKVIAVDREFIFPGFIPVIAKKIIGHVDNTEYPLINVNIKMIEVLPVNVKAPVPVLMMFGFNPSFPAPTQPSPDDMDKLNDVFKKMMIQTDPSVKPIFDKYPAYSPVARSPFPNFAAPAGEPSPTDQLLAAGWGYITLDATSIQADNGDGLTSGIIGLVNKGQPRKPDDWGALRAWSWGAARALDYLETDSLVDAKKVGIEGVSRYGKAALITLAFEPRFAIGLTGSPGKGGATLLRRNFGEAVESLTGGGFYWMAGNFLKYGTEESKFGRMTGCDLPVDSHELIALCAPRPMFLSYGIPEKGDANWLDHRGSYRAIVAAGAVYKFLGAKDLGVSNDYMKEHMPPVNAGLLDGQLAWRQHDGGHTDAPNFKYFIPWANKMLGYEKKPQ
ncbi:MAG TPA: hypothetical protein VMI12_08150 [Puia sp.]|nr:hypothetical protein [Puia sp.]